MNKKIFNCFMILVLLMTNILMDEALYADDLEKAITLDNYKILKGSLQEDKQRIREANDLTMIEVKDGKVISKRIGKEKNIKEISKISKELEKRLSIRGKQNEKIEVLIISDWNVSEDEFLKCIESVVGNLRYEKIKFDTISMYATPYQIKRLIERDEIFEILLPEENIQFSFIEDNSFNKEVKKSRVNSSTDMLGVKKARQDFNVTGDLDGNENSYSKNDVVICIVDSGIEYKTCIAIAVFVLDIKKLLSFYY